MSSALEFLEDWYRAQCNGYWEHANGITIETLDSPGWMVTIDVTETALEDHPMPAVRQERSDKDWIACTVEHNKFLGQGDSTKLSEILEVFRKWAGSEQGSKPAAEKSAAGKPSEILRR
jgi:Immunity protein 53